MKFEQPDKKYIHDGHIVYSCQYHIVFCPKYRRPVLTGDIAKRLQEMLTVNQAEQNYKLIESEVMPDHVHLLLCISPKESVTDVIARIKGRTSHDLRQEFPELSTKLPTLWTRSKFVSTCGTVSLQTVLEYIQGQKGV